MSVKVRPYRKRGRERGGFEVDIRIKWPDGDVQRERLRSPVPSKSGSKIWGEQRLVEIFKRGKLASRPAAPTFEEFIPDYLEHARAERQKPSTIIQKERILTHYLKPRFGNRALDSFSAKDEQFLKSQLLELSPKTINNVLVVFNGLMKLGVRLGKIEKSVSFGLLKVAPSQVEFYEPAEFERLVTAARAVDRQHLLLVLLAGEAGLRLGEIIALEQTDIDLERGLLHVRRSEWEGHVTLPKGGRARTVDLTVRLGDELKAHRHLRGERVLFRPDNDPEHSVTQVLLSKWMARIQRRAGLKATGGIHILRHTFCSRLAMLGAPAKAIQELAGHQNLSTTQRYMHLSPSAKSAAIGLLNGPVVEVEESQKWNRGGAR